MKKLVTFVVVLFVLVQVKAQENNIFTKSVKLSEFIPFIAKNYPIAIDSVKQKQLTFLIPVDTSDNVSEKNIIIKQGIRLVLNRLTDNDRISIVAYGEVNGEILPPTSPSESQRILYAVTNSKESISVKNRDGIQLAYDLADANFKKEAINTIILIRNANTISIQKQKNKNANAEKTVVKKASNNAIWLSLISMTPEIIRLLKK